MSKYVNNFIVGTPMGHHISSIEIVGQLANDAGFPVELDMFLEDTQGQRYALNAMTLDRFEDAKLAQPDLGEDESAPHVLVINEAHISLDALVELLKKPNIDVFKPYLLGLE